MNQLPEVASLGTPPPSPTDEDQGMWRADLGIPAAPMPKLEASPPRMTAIRLTRRELEVAAWLGEDLTCDGLAKRLGVSRETIRAHLRNIGRKLGVRSRHAMVARLATAGARITSERGGRAC